MHEQRRQAYLQAMGVNNYAPRFILPNAMVSVICKMPTPVTAPSSEPVASTSDVQPRPATPVQPVTRAPKVELNTTVTKKSVLVASITEEAAVDVEPRFTAELVVSNIGLAFLSSGGLGASQKRLVANIAQAYSRLVAEGQDPDPALQAGHFQWPVAQSRGLPRGESAARDALSAHVLARSERQKLSKVIIFGEALLPYIDDAMLLAEGLEIIKSVSFEELMTEGKAKAALWWALRSVAQA